MADPERQDELARFGFTLVPFLDDELLERLRAARREIGPAPDDPQIATNWSFHSQSREHKDRVNGLLDICRPAVDRVFTDHVAYLSTFITKWPGPHSAFPPHQDPTLVDERVHTGVNLWVPLDDTGPENGMLYVVPGSHRFSAILRAQNVDTGPFSELHDEVLTEHGRGVPVNAGDALVFDNRLIHFSLPNDTDEPRNVVCFGMRPRTGHCVVVRPTTDDSVEILQVADDFYIEVLPATRDGWQPEQPPVATVVNAGEDWDASELARLCAQVEPTPLATMRPPTDLADASALDVGVFCSLCGSSDGLSEADREGQPNAQLQCPTCEASLRVGG